VFTYDGSHRLYAVTDAIGQVTTLHYDHPDDPLKITSVEDPFGRTARFDYNDNGQLAKITDVLGLTSEFTYLAGDFINTLVTGYGTTTFASGEDGANRWIEVTDPEGGKERTEFLHGATGIPFSELAEDVPEGIPVFNQYINYRNTFYFSKKAYGESFNGTTFDYTKARIYHWLHGTDLNTCSGILESTKEAFENRVWFSYPGQTQAYSADATMLTKPAIVARVLDDGSTQAYRYEYNAFGRITKSIDPKGRETTFIYFPNGLDLKEVHQERGATTDLLASYTYWPNRRPQTVTDGAGQTTQFTYNGFGQIKTIQDVQGHVTTANYDPIGYLQGFTGPDPAVTLNLEYDEYGRIRKVRNSDNYTIDTVYDALNRPTQFTYPDGTYEQTIYTLLNVEWTRDRLGRWTHTYFNSIGQVVGVEDPEYRFTGYEWCKCGGLSRIIDPLGRVTSWTNDIQGRVTEKKYPDRRSERYEYEPKSGRLSTVTDAMAQQTHYQYFQDNALKKVDYTSTGRAAVSIAYTYEDDYPRLATMTDGQGMTGYSYWPAGVLGAGKLETVDGPLADDTITYSYDALGRSAGQAINGVSNTPHYDNLGRVDSATNSLGVFGYHYEGVSSRLGSIDIPNGQQTTFSYYDNFGDRSLANITHVYSGGGIISKFDYGYNAPGRIGDWTQQRGTQPATTSKLGYDNVDQLRDVTSRDVGTQAVLKRYVYGYDSGGNRTSEQVDNQVTTELPNDLNQLVRRSGGGKLKVSGALTEPATVMVNGAQARVDANNQFEGSAAVTNGNNQFEVVATDGNGNVTTQRYQVNVPAVPASTQEYDPNGNLTRKAEGTAATTYDWDAANRLTAINTGTGRSEFEYDGLSRRVHMVERESGAVISEKRFVWSGNELCEERDATGGTVTRRYFGSGEQRIGGSDAGIYFYTRDHLGSIREVTDSSGTIRARYDYDVWGQRTKLSGDVDCDFGFTGFYVHGPSGLNFSRTRAYDAGVGRWISRDPIAEKGGLNLYAYVVNDPMNAVDPSGEFAFVFPIVIILVVVLALTQVLPHVHKPDMNRNPLPDPLPHPPTPPGQGPASGPPGGNGGPGSDPPPPNCPVDSPLQSGNRPNPPSPYNPYTPSNPQNPNTPYIPPLQPPTRLPEREVEPIEIEIEMP
jgi:RHS repeat-associated protein